MLKLQTAFLTFSLFLGGCSSVDVSETTGPHGKQAFRLACKHDENCYVQAKRICRPSYNIESSFYDTHEKQFVMLITCETTGQAN